jgi:hypothetical protein
MVDLLRQPMLRTKAFRRGLLMARQKQFELPNMPQLPFAKTQAVLPAFSPSTDNNTSSSLLVWRQV